jgi:NACHT domain
VRQSSIGGQANEAGSLHRAGAAAYLAAHGLAGAAVEAAGYAEGGPYPVSIALESGDAVDDIRCGLSDGTLLFVQAKRECGLDKQFRSTVTQWVAQVPALRDGDRMALATGRVKGKVRALGPVLARRRSRHAAAPSPAEEEALRALLDALQPMDLAAQARGRLLDAAVVMEVSAETPVDAGFSEAARLLEGVIVPAGQGSRAMQALQRAFHEQAALRSGSGLDEWLRVLADAGLVVLSDPDGPIGTRRQAVLDAMARYRACLAEQAGLLSLSALAEDLPPLRVEGLLDGLRVAYDSTRRDRAQEDPVEEVACRWRRMLLLGLPGAGKSTAMRELAAGWAGDDCAPVPVLVPLRDLAQRLARDGGGVSLVLLVEVALAEAAISERRLLVEELVARLERGEAALLLDGLDECGGIRGRVAEGLAKVVRELPEASPVVVSSRDSAAAAGSMLGLPPARMIEPRSLGHTLDALLQHIAAHRVPQDKREQWLRERRRWLAAARHADMAVRQVPLLATLLTLLAAGDVRRPAPQRRAQLLAEVVRDSVRRWEARRARELVDPLLPAQRPELLMDAYAEIGHMLSSSAGGGEAEIHRVVSVSLRDRWGLAPGEADAVAEDVLRFWDEEVGIFVVGGDGTVQSRTRLFAEIGDAMWAARSDPSVQEAWLDSALTDEERRECVLLAAGLSSTIAETLAKRAVSTPVEAGWRLLRLAADAVSDGASLSEPTLARLIDRLAQVASNSSSLSPPDSAAGQGALGRVVATYAARQRKWDGEGWVWALRLARLQLPPALRSAREEVIGRLPLDEEHTVVARAVAALADTRADRRDALDSSETERVRAMLALQLPIRERQVVRRSRRSIEFVGESAPLIEGHAEAAEEATAFIGQLGEDAAERLYETAKRAAVGSYDRVSATLHEAGYPDPEPPMRRIAALFADPWSEWERFYELVADVSEPDTLTLVEAWALPHLCAIVDTLDFNNAGIADVTSAFTRDHPAFLATVVRIQAAAAGIPLGKLAAEGTQAQQIHRESPRRVPHLLLTPAARPIPLDEPLLSPADVEQLLDCLGASAALTANFAFDRLVATDSRIGRRIQEMLPGLHPQRRRNAALLACLLADDPAATAEELLDGDDGPTRTGAASYLAWEARRIGRGSNALLRARADLDLTVRLVAARHEGAEDGDAKADEANGYKAPSATHWTCEDCAGTNDLEVLDCSMCPTGARPGPHSFPD